MDKGFIEKDDSIEIFPSKEEVLNSMQCREGDLIYESVSKEFDALSERIINCLDLRRTIFTDGRNIYISITAGVRISDLSQSLFDDGEGVGGLIVNNAADCALFAAEEQTAESVKYLCARWGKGISERLENTEDQHEALMKAPLEGVMLTDAGMLSPVKSMSYKLVLSDETEVFRAQHNCALCPCKDCPRRMAPFEGEFKVISDFEYKPRSADGVCIDIGTTTIAAIRLENGKTVASHSELNRQRRFGADVLSRIEAANSGRAAELRSAVEYQLRSCISAVGGEGKRIIAAANTTMVSLLMGYDCSQLGVYPFRAESLENVFCEKAGAELVGGISAFVGGDITSGLYMCGFDENEEVCLFIDLGTNGEMAIGNKNGILCTSTAAGPAFEGGKISCGTGSVDGAICAVSSEDGILKAETINGAKPCGICGTGLVELMAELLNLGYIDRTGLINKHFGGKIAVSEGVYINQSDIRELQTAKGAIRAGIEILISEYGIDESEISRVYIAGGFGKRLNTDKACAIGLLPPQLAGKYISVGNSSLGGCAKLLDNTDGFEHTDMIRRISKDFPLAEKERFTDLYIKYMDF